MVYYNLIHSLLLKYLRNQHVSNSLWQKTLLILRWFLQKRFLQENYLWTNYLLRALPKTCLSPPTTLWATSFSSSSSSNVILHVTHHLWRSMQTIIILALCGVVLQDSTWLMEAPKFWLDNAECVLYHRSGLLWFLL